MTTKECKPSYKFDIVGQKQIEARDDFPKFFFADSKEEAEEIYIENKNRLNNLAGTYAKHSGIDKSDLFAVALTALGKSKADWDASRSDDFGAYSTFVIKAALLEYVRNNSSQITVPSYVRKASVILHKIKDICDKYSFSSLEIISENAINIPNISEVDKSTLSTLLRSLENAAERAKVKVPDLVERVNIIPCEVGFDTTAEKLVESERERERLEARLIVGQIKRFMDDIELDICKMIMEEKSYSEIGDKLGKSPAWVCGKMKVLRDKLVKVLEI